MVVNGDNVMFKIVIVMFINDLEGIKICGIYGQKGVFNCSEDLIEWMVEDGMYV